MQRDAKNNYSWAGQGIHALQDAVAHKGVDMAHHNTWNDIQPSKAEYDQAVDVTQSAVLVTEVMSGNYSHLTSDMTINVDGMTSSQFGQFMRD